MAEDVVPKKVRAVQHKHDFKIRGTIRGYQGKDWTQFKCLECPDFKFVEHGWFQSRIAPTPIARRSNN